jgi:hypothetical protein
LEKFYRLLNKSFVVVFPLVSAPGVTPALIFAGGFVAPETLASGLRSFWLSLTNGLSQTHLELIVGSIEVVIH